MEHTKQTQTQILCVQVGENMVYVYRSTLYRSTKTLIQGYIKDKTREREREEERK